MGSAVAKFMVTQLYMLLLMCSRFMRFKICRIKIIMEGHYNCEFT